MAMRSDPSTMDMSYHAEKSRFLAEFERAKSAMNFLRRPTLLDRARILESMGWTPPESIGDLEEEFLAATRRLGIQNHPTIIQSREAFEAMGWLPPDGGSKVADASEFRMPKTTFFGFSWFGHGGEDHMEIR